MKKKYNIPSVTVIQFEVSDMIVTSIIEGGDSNKGTSVTDADAPRRRGGIWDED